MKEYTSKVSLKKIFNNKSEFAKNVFILLTGTSIAQAIPIAVSPLLTRLYTPEDFGFFTLFVSLASFLSIASTARYEVAIILPSSNKKGYNLVLLSVFFSFIFSIFCFFILVFFNDNICFFLGVKAHKNWLFLLPFSVFLIGIYQSFNYWVNRQKKFKKLAINRIGRSTSIAATQLGCSSANIGPGGLILGSFCGTFFSSIFLGREFVNKKYYSNASIICMKQVAKEYKNFPKFSLLADSINTLANQMPPILFVKLFSDSVAGFYGLTLRVLSMPIALIASAILDVFKQRASDDYNQVGNCKDIYISTLKKLIAFSIIPFGLILLGAPWLFQLVFGNAWRISGEYAQILSIMFFFRFISSPLSYVIYIAGKQVYDLAWQITLISLTIISIYTGFFFKNVRVSLWLFSVSYSILYIIYIFISYRCSLGNLKTVKQ